MAKKKRGRFKFDDLRDAAKQLRRLAPYAFPYWARFLIFGLLVFVYWGSYVARFKVVQPTLTLFQDIASDVATDAKISEVSQGFIDDALMIAGVLFFSGVGMALGTWGKQYLSAWLFQKATIDVQKELAVKIMAQPMSFFNTTRKGELMSRVTNDLGGVRSSFQILYNDLFSHLIGIIVVAGALVHTSPLMTLAVLSLPLVLAPVVILANKIKKVSRRTYEKMAELTNFFHQYFEGIRVVKAFGMEKQQEAELDRSAGQFFRHSIKIGKYKGMSKALSEILLGCLLAAAIVGGASLTSSQGLWGFQTDFPTLAQFIALLMALYDPVRKLSNTLNNMSEAMAANERVFDMMDRIPEMRDSSDAVDAPSFSEEIAFTGVDFEYEGGRPVLQDVSFSAAKGSMTALVGATGAGKSTLLDLIPRFYDPTGGSVSVDGVELEKVRQQSWLAQIAIVAQETFLFNTSVRENLRAARPEATDADLWEALDAANIKTEIEALPQGLDTVLGDRGVNLSGGQRQRLAIARAFVKKAEILLLDEATSALDTETERKVQTALERLIKGATVFAIAHRLSTIMHAEQILVLDQGRIVERGTHEELVAKDGHYARLYRTQVESHAGRGAGVQEGAA